MTVGRKFGDWVLSYRNGYGKRPAAGELGPIVLRIADVSSGRIDLSNPRRGSVSAKEAETYRLQTGDLLFVRVNGAREIVGRCCVVGPEVPPDTVFNDHLIRVRLSPGVDPDFARLCVSVPSARALIEEAASTSAGQLTISQQVLDSIEVPAIPIAEQRKIVARLSAQLVEVEAAQQAAVVQSKAFDALLAAIYREAFAQVVPVAVPPTFGEPPPGWQWHKLNDVARLESGHTPSRSRPEWWGGDVSWLSLTEIRALDGQWVESTRLRTNASGIANSAARILPRGTVCYSRTASVGFVAIMAKPMATSQDFANWVCGDALDPEFLMHALIRVRKQLRELASGATHKTIYMPTLESFHICAPDPDIQRSIVLALNRRLTETTALQSALDAQQTELATLPRRLLSQAFEN